MKIHTFESFSMLWESNGSAIAEIIGDSSVNLYSPLVPSAMVSYPSLNKVGWSTFDLLNAAKKESRVNPNVNLVFVCIGSNDGGYIPTTALKKAASELRVQLSRIFPNAEFIVVKGGWGWGGLSIYDSQTEPTELNNYYNQVWKEAGFKVMGRSQGFSEQHHTTRSPGIASQAKDIENIIRGSQGLYKEDISKMDQIENPGGYQAKPEDIESFYDVIQNAINDRITVSQETYGTFQYNPLVQRVQIALEFLGFGLPRFGADGLYGPETASSVEKFKRSSGIQGAGSEIDFGTLIALFGQLRDNGFDQEELDKAWSGSADLLSAVDITGGDGDYIYYLQHQQGVAGASGLVKAAAGEGKLHPATRANNGRYLVSNMPDKGIANQISQAIQSNDDQRAAILFLNYWANFWKDKRSKALAAINDPKNSEAKEAIESIKTPIPKEFLITVAFIESGLNPKAGNSNYKGLFAITDTNLKKQVPNGDIYNAKDNTFAAVKGMEQGIRDFERMAGSALAAFKSDVGANIS
jgi:peptidoglycan hydrolase-like protein with peptidoglycan-binding domain